MLTKLHDLQQTFIHLTGLMKMGRGNNTSHPQSISKHKPWITYMIIPVSAFLTGIKATILIKEVNTMMLWKIRSTVEIYCFFITKIQTLPWAFPTGAFLDWTSQHRNIDVNLREQIHQVRKHEKWLKSLMCWSLHAGGIHDSLGILLSCHRRTGVSSVHAHTSLPTESTATRICALTRPSCWQP